MTSGLQAVIHRRIKRSWRRNKRYTKCSPVKGDSLFGPIRSGSVLITSSPWIQGPLVKITNGFITGIYRLLLYVKSITGESLILFISGIFLLLTLLLEGGWSIFLGVIWGLSFIVFLYYLIWGANCESHIKTAVQIERLPALCRLRRSERAIYLLLQKIDSAQGRLSREAIIGNLERNKSEALKTHRHVPFIQATPFKEEKGLFHTVLFILLSLYGIQLVADMFYNHMAFTIIETSFSLLILACAVVALVRQHDSDLSSEIKKTTWASMIYIFLDFIIGIIMTFYLMFSSLFDQKAINSEWDMMKMASELSPFESPFILGIYLFTASGALVLGTLGLHFIFKMRTAQKSSH